MANSPEKGDAERKKAELREKIQKRVDCEEKAFRIVERLIDNPITEEFFLDAAQFIAPSHYSDIIEERAIAELCGYPICGKPLGKVPKQKYFISTKTNKVYDITERKNFCSNQCYKASKTFQQQISTTPVWQRENEVKVHFKLLPLGTSRGAVGEEIVVSKFDGIKQELGQLEKLDRYGEALERQKKKTEEKIGEGEKEDESERAIDMDEEQSGKVIKNAQVGLQEDFGKLRLKSQEMHTDPSHGSPKGPNLDPNLITSSTEGLVYDQNRERSEPCSDDKVKSESEKLQKQSEINSRGDTDKKKTKRVNSGKGKSVESQQSKTEYLMKLLDRRKHLLAQMAQIEPFAEPVAEGTCKSSGKGDKSAAGTEQTAELGIGRGDYSSALISEQTTNDGDFRRTGSAEVDTCKSHEKDMAEFKNSEKEQQTEIYNDSSSGVSVIKSIPSVMTNETKLSSPQDVMTCKNKNVVTGKNKSEVNVRSNSKRQNMQTIAMICTNIQQWVSEETRLYLKMTCDQGCWPHEYLAADARSEFDRKFAELGAKVDRQDMELDVLEEETLRRDKGMPDGKLPNYEKLQEETAEFSLKVQEFYKGKSVYSSKKKDTETLQEGHSRTNVVLPTVDSYDQMMIRRKIVMDKLNKIMPDLLSPLKLSIQDIFTELKEMVATFNFTSENILFKPGEWTIVGIMLLKMLSQKVKKAEDSFKFPSAQKYFSILLSGIGGSMEDIEAAVSDLLQREPRS